MAEAIKIGGELESTATGNVVAAASAIKDKVKNKYQSEINAETDAALEDRYTKEQTYSKSELNNMITTPNQKYLTVTATDQTINVKDVLPTTGEANTVYRVGNWDSSQFDASVYSEYAWNGSQYVHLSTKSQVGEVFNISAYHATGGTLATYADLSAALDSNNGGGVPQSLQKGGMRVQFVRTYDNKYVQYRLKVTSFSTDEDDWQGVDDKPINASESLVTSDGIFESDAANTKNMAHILTLIPLETVDNKFINRTGEEQNSASFQYNKYKCQGDKLYLFSGSLEPSVTVHLLFWFDNNNDLLKIEPYKGNESSNVTISQQALKSPSGAAYAYLNVLKSRKNQFAFYQTDILATDAVNNVSMQVNANTSELTSLNPVLTVSGKYIGSDGKEASDEGSSYRKYSVVGGNIYVFSGRFAESISIPMLIWADSEGTAISIEYKGNYGVVDLITDKAVIAPSNAAYAYLNLRNAFVSYFDFCTIADAIINRNLLDNINNIVDNISKRNRLTPSSVIDNTYFKMDGTTSSNNKSMIYKYQVVAGNDYFFSGMHSPSVTTRYIAWADDNDNVIFVEDYGGGSTSYQDQKITAPVDAHYLWLNVQKDLIDLFSIKSIGDIIKSQDLQDEINSINIRLPKHSMKVVIMELEGELDGTPFYIRTKYNNSKDIIITHRTNKNGLITFRAAYIGSNTLTDAQLMASTYRVSDHTDSTAALYSTSDDCPFWATYAQHGYPIPIITNNANMDATDVGAEWKDQLDRHYTIGKVTAELIYLLPVIYVSDGHNTRDWKSPTGSEAITSLTYVSGGSSGHHTAQITADGYDYVQLQPIMEHTRKWAADGNPITETGTYYCDEFSVSESQIGYDPATISDWFGGPDGNPDLTGADITAKFTFSYNYKGAQCAMNTTIAIFKEVITDSYGAIQQQFFYDNGDYKAMFMIPKAKAQNGVELDKPFNSPSSSARGYGFYRTSAYLKDIDELIDRQIGFLYNPNTDDYLVGMAAGLSLVSGDTIKTKRLSLIPQGDTNTHYRLSGFGAQNNNRNKFYIAAFNTAPYEDNGYYLPTTLFKEINCYVCYFDPAENVGQVYWYKDGNSYVIYAHCQSVQSRIPINVPDFMEGLNLTIVEKTSNTDLLTDTIQNGKFFVNYNTNDANYIVLKAD